MRRLRTWYVLAPLLGLAVWACGDGAMTVVSDAMVDAAELLEDAGRALDGASDAAMAQPPVDVPCEEHAYRVTAADGSWSETVSNYAELVMPIDRDAVARVTATVCGYEVLPAPAACPVGSTCTGAPHANLDCYVAQPQFDDGRLRVYCGTWFRTSTGSEGGARYSSVRVHLD